MRRLKLHYISLPKGSPDDNPVETIFSDIQQNLIIRPKQRKSGSVFYIPLPSG